MTLVPLRAYVPVVVLPRQGKVAVSLLPCYGGLLHVRCVAKREKSTRSNQRRRNTQRSLLGVRVYIPFHPLHLLLSPDQPRLQNIKSFTSLHPRARFLDVHTFTLQGIPACMRSRPGQAPAAAYHSLVSRALWPLASSNACSNAACCVPADRRILSRRNMSSR